MSLGLTAEQRQREEKHEKDMAHLKMQIDRLTKHLLSSKMEKVKAVGAHGRDESEDEEEVYYVYNQGVSEAVSKKTKVGTSTKEAKKIKGEITMRN